MIVLRNITAAYGKFMRSLTKATSPEKDASGDSSVVRPLDSWSKGGGFESRQERRVNSFLKGQLFCADSYFGICSIPVLPQ